MARVIPVDDVRYTPAVAVLECGDDAPISFYVTEFPPGEGTPLHHHPYAEVFLVETGSAVFTAGDEELTVAAGNYVLVPAGEHHRYVTSGEEPARVVSVHPSGRVVQTNV